MATVAVARADLDAILARARDGAPDEVCGVLAGRRTEGGGIVVERVVRTRNAHAMPRTHYLVSPEELLHTALRAEDEWGLEVVGFYHSHPEGPPFPSRTDERSAGWPGAAYLVAWLAPGEGLGAWVWDGHRFVPAVLVARDAPQ